MNKLKSNAKMMLFLLWFAPKSKRSTIGIPATFASLLTALWSYPLDNLPYLYALSKQELILPRSIGSLLLFAIFLVSFSIHYLLQRKKYRDIPHLSKEELDAFNNYFNVPKPEPRVRWL